MGVSQGGEQRLLGMCFPGRGTDITRDIGSPGRGTHITTDMCFPGRGTHITKDMCFPSGGTHITRDILGQNHRLTVLEKCQFFDFENFLFL